MDRITKHNRIVLMKAQGASVSDIAAALGMAQTSVRSVLKSHSHCITDREPPAGLSIRVAWLIDQTFGFWPSAEHAEEMARMKIQFLRAPNANGRQWREIEAWAKTSVDAANSGPEKR